VKVPSFTPASLVTVRDAFDHADWIFEPKLDGFRALAILEEYYSATWAGSLLSKTPRRLREHRHECSPRKEPAYR
jgi:hypothetical protein